MLWPSETNINLPQLCNNSSGLYLFLGMPVPLVAKWHTSSWTTSMGRIAVTSNLGLELPTAAAHHCRSRNGDGLAY